MISLTGQMLAAVGIYGVIAYTVAQRTSELGLRIALGARTKDVLRLMLLQGGRIIGAGIGAGLVLSLMLARFISSLLYEVSIYDPGMFIALIVALAMVGIFACLVPSLRAAKISPLIALSHR